MFYIYKNNLKFSLIPYPLFSSSFVLSSSPSSLFFFSSFFCFVLCLSKMLVSHVEQVKFYLFVSCNFFFFFFWSCLSSPSSLCCYYYYAIWTILMKRNAYHNHINRKIFFIIIVELFYLIFETLTLP